MRFCSRLVASLGLLFSVASALAQPANDNCATPQAQSDIVTFVSTNVGATNDGNASCGGTADIWFSYIASATGTVAVDTCGSDFDTTLAAFTSCGGTELACDDNSGCGNTSRIDFAVTSGQSYRIRVAGKNGATGNVVITASVVPTGNNRPSNDDCEDAEVVGNGATNGTNVASTTDATAACVTSVASGKDVWYKYTPVSSGNATIHTLATEQLPNGSVTDTVLSVFNNCEGTELACNDDANSGTLYSSVSIAVTGGTSYFIRVAGSLGQAGTFVLTIDGPAGSGNGNTNGGNDNTNGGNDNTNSGNDNTNSGNDNTNGGNDNTNSGNDNTNGGNDNTNGGNDNTNSGNDNTNSGNDNTNGGNDNTNSGNDNTNGGNDNTNGGNNNDNGDPNVDTPNDVVSQCAAGLCGGTNALAMLPLTLLGIACLKAGSLPLRRRTRGQR